MTFLKRIENEKQNQIILKKSLSLASSEAKDDPYLTAYMIMSLTSVLSQFDPLNPDPFDKAEAIKSINALHRSLLATFITKILKNKNNMNQNDYLLKVEGYLMLIG